MGPKARLGTHAHRPADQTPTCTKPPGSSTRCAAAERRCPHYPTIQWPSVQGKLDDPREGAQPPATVERYAERVGPEAHAEPQVRNVPSTVTMVVLGNRRYYQVRIRPRQLVRG